MYLGHQMRILSETQRVKEMACDDSSTTMARSPIAETQCLVE